MSRECLCLGNFLETSGNVPEISGIPEIRLTEESSQIISGSFSGFLGQISGNIRDVFGCILDNFRGNFKEFSGKFPGKIQEISGKFPRNFHEMFGNFHGMSRKNP